MQWPKQENAHLRLGYILDIDWLDCQQMYHKFVEVFKLVNNTGQNSLTTKFEAAIPSRVLISDNKIKLEKPLYRLKHSENDFLFRGITFWDRLPADIYCIVRMLTLSSQT